MLILNWKIEEISCLIKFALRSYTKIKTLTLTKTSTCILESIPLYSVTSKSKTSRFVSISNDYFQYRNLWLKIFTVYNCSTDSFDKLASITKFWRISMTDDAITKLYDVKFRQIEGDGGKFRYIKLSNSVSS